MRRPPARAVRAGPACRSASAATRPAARTPMAPCRPADVVLPVPSTPQHRHSPCSTRRGVSRRQANPSRAPTPPSRARPPPSPVAPRSPPTRSENRVSSPGNRFDLDTPDSRPCANAPNLPSYRVDRPPRTDRRRTAPASAPAGSDILAPPARRRYTVPPPPLAAPAGHTRPIRRSACSRSADRSAPTRPLLPHRTPTPSRPPPLPSDRTDCASAHPASNDRSASPATAAAPLRCTSPASRSRSPEPHPHPPGTPAASTVRSAASSRVRDRSTPTGTPDPCAPPASRSPAARPTSAARRTPTPIRRS
ncbi:Uncharacterised protein [Burkholderia pseudomallei]|nr:Uncharacterised protein [Burkholderia pseudomallei]VBV65900.1 Uncharacterised protein [Burkholderia pseudomallei]VCC44253.1 Uncharacterised protein [Burkholderia pseudomallei]VCJ52515.1 Uncharacterised protein [Burkholderia pseudomallei]VCR75276.1 Uncharacterised protein [Burkholderia pseudomallei]